MAYCPLAQAGRLRDGLFQHSDIINMANARGITVAQLLLAWVIRHQGVLAIPKAASIEHVVQNAAALDIVLSGEELAQLDCLYPPPQRKPGWIWFNPSFTAKKSKSPGTKGLLLIAVFHADGLRQARGRLFAGFLRLGYAAGFDANEGFVAIVRHIAHADGQRRAPGSRPPHCADDDAPRR